VHGGNSVSMLSAHHLLCSSSRREYRTGTRNLLTEYRGVGVLGYEQHGHLHIRGLTVPWHGARAVGGPELTELILYK